MQPAYQISDILKEVRTSGCLGQSQRQFNLFEFLLTESLNERHLTVTQYGIAVDILDRDDSFDAASDSIVRVEMHRLRSNLKKFNAVSDQYDLHIPRASYQVIVRPKSETPLSKTKSKFTLAGLAIASLIFTAGFFTKAGIDRLLPNQNLANCSQILPNVFVKNGGPSSENQNYVDRVIRTTLKQHTNLNLISTGQACANEAAPFYTLDYLFINRGDATNISLTLNFGETNTPVNFNQIAISDSTPQDEIFYKIATELNKVAKPYGIIARNASTQRWPSSDARESFTCLIIMYDSFASDSQADFAAQHACLEKSITTDMHSLDNKGGLIASYLQLAREGKGSASTEAYNKAVAIIDEVGENWVNSAEMVVAKLYHESQREDFIADRLRTILLVADTKYNSNAIIQLYVAQNFGLAVGDWEKAKQISDRHKRMAPDRDGSTYIIDAAYALLHVNPSELMATCQTIDSPNSIFINILLRACAIKANDPEWRTKAEKNLANANFDIERDLQTYVETRNIEPRLKKHLLAR